MEERTRGGREIRVERSEGEGQTREKASPWEWAAAALSAVLVLGVIGFMGYEAFTEPDTPPRIEIAVDTIAEQPSGYLVQFTARNTGQTTAAGLVVEGELKTDTGVVETAQVTINYVPAEAFRVAGLFFSRDPRDYALEVRPRGYDRP